jgi:sugar phosphate isomerase/epimerase
MLKNIALNQGTIRHLPLEEALNIALHSKYPAFGVWSERVFTEIDAGRDEEEICQIIKDSGMKIVEFIHLKEWLFIEGTEKKTAFKHVETMCRIAQKIGAECITAPAYGFEGDEASGIQNFKDFCDIAAHYQVKVAIEFVPCFKVGDLLSAYNIVESANKTNGGIVADTFHVFKGKTQLSDFLQIPIDKIFLVHLCDGAKQETAIDFIEEARGYRLFPGQGYFDLQSLVDVLNQRGYAGYYSLEVLNKNFVNRDPHAVAREGMQSFANYN